VDEGGSGVIAGSGWVLVAVLAAVASDETPRGLSSIDAGDLERHVGYLASDKLAGRETGTASITTAEDYIARAFRATGLTPLPDRDSYFIEFTLYRTGFESDGTSVSLSSGEESRIGVAGVDFTPFDFSDDGEVEAEVVFAGYGITAPEQAYDDYAGLDVTGKLVLVLRHTPGENDPDSPFDGAGSNDHATFRSKAANAAEHGARGMLLVTDPLNHEPGDNLRLVSRLRLDPPSRGDDATEGQPFLAVHISRDMATVLLSGSGRELADLQRAVNEGEPPSGLSLTEASAAISVRRTAGEDIVVARNVAGFLEGADPELKDEWIVVGGHHDHVGAFVGEGDTVFNGADDNASGVSGVLELAQAFATLPEKPRRSVMFVTFTGEEKGLLGSRAMVTRELIPVGRVAFMLNLDMIGRNPDQALQVFGDGYVRGLRETVEQANAGPSVELEFAGNSYAGNSDHDAFHDRDIPFMFLFTGTHDDYHQLGDHAAKLDYDRMESIVRLAFGVVDRLAGAESAPGFVHNVTWLGVRAESLPDDAGVIEARVTAVEADSRAESTGFEVGDVLLAFDERTLESPDEIGDRFRAIKPGTTTTIRVRRKEDKHDLTVQRARTGYLGVAPEPVDEDLRAELGLGPDEGLRMGRVLPDGPAARSGIKEGDILILIAGRPVGVANLRSRLEQIGAGETIEVRAIRDGRRIALQLTLGERPRQP
jgi:hypothetical protein